MRLLTILALSCAASHTTAALIDFDPNSFDEGAVLNEAMDNVRVSTLEGGNVYASALIGEGQEAPPGFVHSGPVGNQVFSTSPTRNTEWMASELWFEEHEYATLDALRTHHGGFLLFDFSQPVSYISLLSLELFPDAGWGGGSDPQRFFLYDANGDLLETRMEGPMNPLPVDEHADLWEDASPYAYIYNEFNVPGVSYLAAAGESEPTTYGRLSFRNSPAAQVPEPSSLVLVTLGLVAVVFRRRGVKGGVTSH